MAALITNEKKYWDKWESRFEGECRDGMPVSGLFSFRARGGRGAMVHGHFTATDKLRPNVGQFVGSGWCTDKYEGEWDEGTFHGKGEIKYGRGGHYKGEFHRGMLQGNGVKVWPNGDTYEGEWAHGDRHGKGVFTAKSGLKYEGQWVDDKRSGKGVCVYENGAKYDGEWLDDKRHGDGEYLDERGGLHVCKWERDNLCGTIEHKFKPPEEDIFELVTDRLQRWENPDGSAIAFGGKWKDGKMFFGTIAYFDKFGRKILRGKFYRNSLLTEDGNRYECDSWTNGRVHGIGARIWPDSSQYIGDWNNGVIDGFGKMTYANGDVYNGEWRRGKRNGKGTLTPAVAAALSANSEVTYPQYDGWWLNDKKHGVGRQIDEDGTGWYGVYDKDKKTARGVAFELRQLLNKQELMQLPKAANYGYCIHHAHLGASVLCEKCKYPFCQSCALPIKSSFGATSTGWMCKRCTEQEGCLIS